MGSWLGAGVKVEVEIEDGVGLAGMCRGGIFGRGRTIRINVETSVNVGLGVQVRDISRR